mmetsp:Transcript_106835/g.212140  ORF Transcript_106835/g.212140 Transcript_106835/m.212140 type:complete len:178 (+) Transcript_106835:51-584(+)
MAPCGVPLLVLWLLVWLKDGAADLLAAGVEAAPAVGSNATTQGQCRHRHPLANHEKTAGGSLFFQISSVLEKRTWQEAALLVRHAPARKDGHAQRHERQAKAAPTATAAPQPAMPQIGTQLGFQRKYSRPNFLGRFLDFSEWGWVTLLLPIIALAIMLAILSYEIVNDERRLTEEIG